MSRHYCLQQSGMLGFHAPVQKGAAWRLSMAAITSHWRMRASCVSLPFHLEEAAAEMVSHTHTPLFQTIG